MSPEDNKLRLYADARLSKDLYARVRGAGFIWAPKQELFVAPAWSPDREDLLLELAGEIDDEDKSLVDRAEERSERFEEYSEARQADANRAHDAVEAISDGSAPQLFPTQDQVADQLVHYASIEDGHRVLEPSAGTGSLLAAVGRIRRDVTAVAVEINFALAEHLRGRFLVNVDVRCSNFLECNGDLGTFDRIVMNPPFERGADIEHIEHALKFLKPGGRLVAICANGPRQQAKLMERATSWIDLPAGSFSQQGTGVNTAIVVFDAEER